VPQSGISSASAISFTIKANPRLDLGRSDPSDNLHPLKRYLSFDSDNGFPNGPNLFYECTFCGGIIPSLPKESVKCTCGNVFIDMRDWELAVRDSRAVKLFEEIP
jgi:hypothetical protein